jgi:hypothetical protein
MRYLFCAALMLGACQRRDTGHDNVATDTAPPLTDTIRATSNNPPGQTMSALPDRLIGRWTAKGYDAGSSRPQRFTIEWNRAPDGSLAGNIAFESGEKYGVKVVSTSDSTFVYESDQHLSPTLKTQVVTHTVARLVGDTLKGTYEAKGKNGKSLRGRFLATRGS